MPKCVADERQKRSFEMVGPGGLEPPTNGL